MPTLALKFPVGNRSKTAISYCLNTYTTLCVAAAAAATAFRAQTPTPAIPTPLQKWKSSYCLTQGGGRGEQHTQQRSSGIKKIHLNWPGAGSDAAAVYHYTNHVLPAFRRRVFWFRIEDHPEFLFAHSCLCRMSLLCLLRTTNVLSGTTLYFPLISDNLSSVSAKKKSEILIRICVKRRFTGQLSISRNEFI